MNKFGVWVIRSKLGTISDVFSEQKYNYFLCILIFICLFIYNLKQNNWYFVIYLL